MIIVAGEGPIADKVTAHLSRKLYWREPHITSFHGRAIGANARDDLLRLIVAPPLNFDLEVAMNKTRVSYHEYVARIKTIDEQTSGHWYLHDFRPFWFFDQFSKLVPECKVIAIVSDGDDYLDKISEFISQQKPNDALLLNKFDKTAVDKFLTETPIKTAKATNKKADVSE